MDIFTFVASLLLAFVGLFVGTVLAHYSEEEVHYIKKYLPFLQMMTFMLIFVLIYWYLPFFIASSLLILSFAFIYLFWHRKNINLLDYIVLAVLFSLTSLEPHFHLYMTTLVFIFGIFSGALFYVLHRKHHSKPRDILHHKHSGKHLSFGHLSVKLFDHYFFFLIISFVSYLLAILLKQIIF